MGSLSTLAHAFDRLSVETPVLNIACEISGPARGDAVLLLHGWPDGPRTWDRVVPLLHEAGFRTIVPALRGVGETRFLNDQTMRSGQLSALAQDVIDLANALKLEKFGIIGHDWGARAAYIASALWSERVTHCAALSVGWGTNTPDQTLSLKQVQNYWYHWYMALDRGAGLLRDDRIAFTQYVWSIWNPNWQFSEQEFSETATMFNNPDWADVVLHSYRVRWGLADKDPAYAPLEARLSGDVFIQVPTLLLHGGADPANDIATSEGKERLFKGPYQREVLAGIGHFPQREAGQSVAARLVQFLGVQT